jgi:hypothetical protein
MTLKQRLILIKDTLEAGLPALLSTASLDDFASYRIKSPANRESLQLCVYPDVTTDITSSNSESYIIQAQLYSKNSDEMVDYYDVIIPFIRGNITANLLSYERREKIDTEFFPLSGDSSTSFIFFSIVFETSLDDCEEY